MSEIFFQPWVGSEYRECGLFNKKVLVLGEAHYQWEENQESLPSDFTIQVIQDASEGRKQQFFTNIVKSFLGRSPTDKDKRDFWNSVSFYNFIQESVGFGARVRPTKEMWESASVPFTEVLNKLQPDIIIVLGHALWDNLPDLNGRYGPKLKCKGRPQTWIYKSKPDLETLAFSVKHPSAGFSSEYWHPFIKEVINN